MLTVDEINQEFRLYHQVNFATEAEALPKLDVLVVYSGQHAEVFVGEKAIPLALQLAELLRRMAHQRGAALILYIPVTAKTADFADYGFVRSPKGWATVC